MKKKGGFGLFYGLLFSISLSLLYIHKPGVIDFLDNKIYDARLKRLCIDETPGNPVIVDIDEKSLNTFGQWPWPRRRIALLLEKIRGMGASSVGIDILLAEPDGSSPHRIKKELLRDLNVDVEFKGLPRDMWDNDKILADALSRGPFVMGFQFLFDHGIRSEPCVLHPLNLAILKKGGASDDPPPFFSAPGALCSLDVLAKASAASGFLNAAPDRDGILRSAPLIIEHENKFYPSLALAVLARFLKVEQVFLKSGPHGWEFLHLDQIAIPLSANGSLLIRYRGRGKSFPYISAGDILSDRIPGESIRGKIVLLGTSASGMKDFRSTPLDPMMPGVEIHAAIVDTILGGDFFSRPGWIFGLELLLVLASGAISTLLLAWSRAGWSLLLLALGALGVWWISEWALQARGVYISPVFPFITLGFNFTVLTSLKFWKEQRLVKRRTRELALTQQATIECMTSLVEARDPETGGHIKRTQAYVMILAKHLKKHPDYKKQLDDEYIELLYYCAPLHDIGKVGVQDKVLLKPGKLSDEEFEEMKKHTVYGRDAILSAETRLGENSFFHVARNVVYAHHEKWDGSGYPEHLKGEDIPLFGRLMAVADVYDALISKRVYKPPMSHKKAIQIIVEGKGVYFDPDIVDAFLEVEDRFLEIALKYLDFEEERTILEVG